MYQNIIKSINNLCNKKILGFNNLFSKSKGLFNSPKGKIYKYLLEQANKNVSISLYVPETIGKCITCRFSSKSCHCGDDVVKKFNKISKDNDNWIGLFIWQHKTAEECNYNNLFRCKGTTKSGKSRELTEGKKYSSKAYEISYHGGLASLNNAPGGRIIIHNGGGAKIYDLGEEFIEIFVKHLVDEFKAKHDIDLSKDKIVMPRLRREGAKLKYLVEKNYGSMKKDYNINLPYISHDGKKSIHIETKLTVNQFENLLGPLIQNKKDNDSDKFTKSIIREIILPGKKSILSNVNFDDYNAYYIYGKDKKID